MRINTYSIYLLVFLSILSIGCKKRIILPSITTLSVSNIFANEAISGGVISSQGSGNVLSRGVVWSTSQNPTISLSTKTTDSSGVGTFSSKLFGLSANTKYYLRAYATIASGIAYGNEVSFTTNDIELSKGLLLFYPFSGNAGDSSGNGNHGIVFGSVFNTDRFNMPNKALSFNGTSNYLESKNISLINNASIACWIYPVGNNGSIISKSRDAISNSGYELLYSNSVNGIYGHVGWSGIENNNIIPTPRINLELNKWNHVVLIILNSAATLYLNGTSIYSKSQLNQVTQNSDNILIGRSVWGGNIFSGKLDDIRIYNRALTQSEITYLASH